MESSFSSCPFGVTAKGYFLVGCKVEEFLVGRVIYFEVQCFATVTQLLVFVLRFFRVQKNAKTCYSLNVNPHRVLVSCNESDEIIRSIYIFFLGHLIRRVFNFLIACWVPVIAHPLTSALTILRFPSPAFSDRHIRCNFFLLFPFSPMMEAFLFLCRC